MLMETRISLLEGVSRKIGRVISRMRLISYNPTATFYGTYPSRRREARNRSTDVFRGRLESEITASYSNGRCGPPQGVPSIVALPDSHEESLNFITSPFRAAGDVTYEGRFTHIQDE